MNRLFAALSLCLVAACNTTIDATHYSQTCTVDADCTLVHSGQLCGGCDCPNAAINVKDAARYDNDVSTLMRFCGPGPRVMCSCIAASAHCTSGTCVETSP